MAPCVSVRHTWKNCPLHNHVERQVFAYVAVSGPAHDDPAKNWGTSNRKRARTQGGQTDAQKEAQSARRQRDIERKIRELNNDNSKDVQIPLPKNQGGGAAARSGKTTQTKKILNSGKNFAHYLDDEEAEIARTGRRDGDAEAVQGSASLTTRPSKTPIARRKAREESTVSNSPVPSALSMPPPPIPQADAMEIEDEVLEDGLIVPRLPTAAEMDALLNAPALSFNQARSAPPPPGAPPPRQFCETCGYWG